MAKNVAAEILEDEGEALIESSFRRLLTATEAERSRIRSTWQEVSAEKDQVREEINRLRQTTEDSCKREQAKVENKYKELDQLRDRMTVVAPDAGDILQINCSGEFIRMQKSVLVGLEGSLLNHMFSDAFIGYIPRDQSGHYFLDFNPVCFRIIVECLAKRRPGGQPAVPEVPPEQQMNFDFLVEALKIKPLLRPNAIMINPNISLRVTNNVIESTSPGCQVTSARYPVPLTGPYYFEVKIISNPSAMRGAKGGLAIGVCGHIPTGQEVYTIRFNGAIFYSSGNGLVGKDTIGASNVQGGMSLVNDSTFGVKYTHRRVL